MNTSEEVSSPTLPAVPIVYGPTLPGFAALTGNIRIWAAPDDLPPTAATAVLTIGRNVSVSAHWSDTEDPLEGVSNPIGTYNIFVPTQTGTLVADLTSPEFQVWSMGLNEGTMNADCSGQYASLINAAFDRHNLT